MVESRVGCTEVGVDGGRWERVKTKKRMGVGEGEMEREERDKGRIAGKFGGGKRKEEVDESAQIFLSCPLRSVIFWAVRELERGLWPYRPIENLQG